MNRCVRVMDKDGLSVLAARTEVVKVGETATFRDVLARTLPNREIPVTRVQLKHAVNTPDTDAINTRELDEKIYEGIQLVSCSQGFEPMMITYVEELSSKSAHAPTASGPSTSAAATQAGGETVDASADDQARVHIADEA